MAKKLTIVKSKQTPTEALEVEFSDGRKGYQVKDRIFMKGEHGDVVSFGQLMEDGTVQQDMPAKKHKKAK